MPFKHIFVVGFPPASLANLNYLLQITGCRVTTAKDAAEAVSLMLNKKFSFRTLDLILMSNCVLFVQFMDTFNGPVKLSRKYRFLVVDEFDQREKFKELLEENSDQYEVEFCSNDGLIRKFKSLLH